MKQSWKYFFVFGAIALGSNTWAAGGSSGHAFEFSVGLMNAPQTDMNNWISSVNQAGTNSLGSGYEFMFDYQYRFSSSMFALKFRPSMYTVSSSGGGIDTSLNGMTFFPMLRLYPLENNFIKFFLQVGLGWGQLSGKMSNNGASAEFAGSAFGAESGLGAEFCFAGRHCVVIEGNLRYLPIERNIVKTSSGNLGGSITRSGAGGELESNSNDLGTTLSGIQGVLGYQLYF